MNSELFKERHPHQLGDYLARGFVAFSRSVVNMSAKKNFAKRALISNTVLSSLSMVLANSLHHKAVYRVNPDREPIEDLLCEASGTHFHIIVIRKFIIPTKAVKVLTAILQAVSIFIFRMVAYISSGTAHRALGYIYERSILDYTLWIEAITSNEAPNLPANPIAVKYWELAEGSTLIEVLEAMRNDNLKYRDDEHKFADEKI